MVGYTTLKESLFLIAGPCVIENEMMGMEIAQAVKDMCSELNIPYIFKASYKKANRSSISSFTGIGDVEALTIIKEIGQSLDIATTTDVHSIPEVHMAARYVDILQIPAFLCRQTDLLVAAAETGKIINIKKGQFMSAEAMSFAVEKIWSTNNRTVFLTERGTSFGYEDLVVDFRSIPIMKKFAPVIMDCTHSLQKPNQSKGVTGGEPQYIALMAKAAVVAGANGLFIETHPHPSKALSDGANMLPLNELSTLLRDVKKLSEMT